MGLADRDYMRERVRDRGGVFRPGTRHANPRRQRLQSVILVGIAIAAVPAYRYLNDRSPPPMRQASTPSLQTPAQPELTDPGALHTIMNAPMAPAQEFPASGTTQWYRENDQRQQTGLLRIMDTSDLPGNKVVRIRDAFGTPVAQTYIRDQEGAQLLLPLGRYEMTIAFGNTWYGPERQFGGDARYFQTSGADVIAGEMNYRILPSGQGGQPLNPIVADAF